MSDTAPAPIRPAATIVLVRQVPTQPFEIFFVRRHAKSAFMANAYVFPGGRVDENDAAAALRERLTGVSADLVARMEDVDDHATACTLVIAALRETFEEAGVLLAHRRDGSPLVDEDMIRLAQWRDRLNAGDVTFLELLEAEDLYLDGHALTYFAHWVTPVQERRRYAARFFLARAPQGQRYVHDAIETTDSCWRSPAQALADYQAGDFSLAPPTWRILNDLKAQNSLESLWNWSLRDNPVPRIDPVMSLDEGSVVLALPGDRMHSGSGEGLRRIVLRDRRWVWISAT